MLITIPIILSNFPTPTYKMVSPCFSRSTLYSTLKSFRRYTIITPMHILPPSTFRFLQSLHVFRPLLCFLTPLFRIIQPSLSCYWHLNPLFSLYLPSYYQTKFLSYFLLHHSAYSLMVQMPPPTIKVMS